MSSFVVIFIVSSYLLFLFTFYCLFFIIVTHFACTGKLFRAQGKLSSCEDDLRTWFDHPEESFLQRSSMQKILAAYENKDPLILKTLIEPLTNYLF